MPIYLIIRVHTHTHTHSRALFPVDVMVGVVFAAFPAAMVVVSPLVPACAGTFGRVPVLCAGLGLTAAALLLFAAADSLWWWVALRAAQGAGSAFTDIAVTALILAHSVEMRRGAPSFASSQRWVLGQGSAASLKDGGSNVPGPGSGRRALLGTSS